MLEQYKLVSRAVCHCLEAVGSRGHMAMGEGRLKYGHGGGRGVSQKRRGRLKYSQEGGGGTTPGEGETKVRPVSAMLGVLSVVLVYL